MRRILALSLVLVAAAALAPSGALAESVQEKLDKARADQQSAQTALAEAEDHLDAVLEDYRRLRAELDQAAADVVQGYAQQEALSEQLAAAQERLDQRVTAAYEMGPGAAIDMFLGAQSAADLASVQVYIGGTFQLDDSSVSEVTGLKASLAAVVADREASEHDLAARVASVLTESEQAAEDEAAAKETATAAGLKVKQLEDEEAELERAQAEAAAALANYLGSGEVGAGCASGTVHDLIVDAFSPLGQDQVNTALVVATRESNCRPNAWNPTEVPPYGNAAGVFQILYPGIWGPWSERCGHAGDSPFDAKANVEVAACTVAEQGWWPWGV